MVVEQHTAEAVFSIATTIHRRALPAPHLDTSPTPQNRGGTRQIAPRITDVIGERAGMDGVLPGKENNNLN